MLIFNTGYWTRRSVDFHSYANGFPAVSPEAAMFIRTELAKVKAVAIDTLSIENVGPDYGVANGFKTHRTFLNPDLVNDTILIYEDINMEPLIGKKLIRAFCTPLRIRADAANCNIFCEIED